MKIDVIKRHNETDTNGEAYSANTITGESEVVTWSIPGQKRSVVTEWVEEGKVFGVLATLLDETGRVRIVASYTGTVGTVAPPADVMPLDIAVPPDFINAPSFGDIAYIKGYFNGQNYVVKLDYSTAPATALIQPDGTFNAGYKDTTIMYFEDGNARLMRVAPTTMSLSSVLGNGQPLDLALTIPYSEILFGQGSVSQIYANMIYTQELLGKAALAAGLGKFTSFQPWVIFNGNVSPINGQVLARDDRGLLRVGVASPNGPALGVLELEIDERGVGKEIFIGDFATPSGWDIQNIRVGLSPISQKKPFWQAYVRAFEVIEPA